MSYMPVFLVILFSFSGLVRCAPDPLDKASIDKLYTKPLPPADKALSVYFIGHSLVGRQMPAMLAQLAGNGHSYASQLGWGAELEAHWEPDIELSGGDVENAHEFFREAHEAVGSGDYDVVVLTEKVEIKDSIKYHKSWNYLALWAETAWTSNPDARVYLYETWHTLDDAEGWLERLDRDLSRYWEGEILDRALAVDRLERPIYVIPGGQVMARFVREVQKLGGVEGIKSEADLFEDNIHFNDIGAYLIALTHYAVIYGKSPIGLPHELKSFDNSPAKSPGPVAASLMQNVVWEVVTSYPRTGVRGD